MYLNLASLFIWKKSLLCYNVLDICWFRETKPLKYGLKKNKHAWFAFQYIMKSMVQIKSYQIMVKRTPQKWYVFLVMIRCETNVKFYGFSFIECNRKCSSNQHFEVIFRQRKTAIVLSRGWIIVCFFASNFQIYIFLLNQKCLEIYHEIYYGHRQLMSLIICHGIYHTLNIIEKMVTKLNDDYQNIVKYITRNKNACRYS